MPTAYAPLGDDPESKKSLHHGKPLWKRCSKAVVNSTCFKVLSLLALFIALFGGGVVIILDLPDDPTNIVVDSVMTTVMVFFVVELVLRSASENDYPCSFFFWMDVLGTVSMVFEISFMCGTAGKIYETDSGPNTAVVRTARAARIGARAGRLSKPLRILSMLFRGKKEDRQEAGYTAKVLGTRLTQVFSSKVAMLTVVLTLGVPVFNIGRYPEDDFSMRSWGYKLEMDYSRDYKALGKGQAAPGFFEGSVEDMRFFYGELDYFPFQLDGYDEKVQIGKKTFVIPTADVMSDSPKRKSNIVMLEVDKCLVPRPGCENGDKAAVYFDFRIANQYSAGMDMAVVVFIIACMCIESCDLTYSIKTMMVNPMERMLDSANLMAKQLNQAMAKARGKRVEVVDTSAEMDTLTDGLTRNEGDDDDEDIEGDAMNEIEVLQGVFKKVVFLLNILVDDQHEEELSSMDVESKGVLQEIKETPPPEIDQKQRPSGATSHAVMSQRPSGRSETTSVSRKHPSTHSKATELPDAQAKMIEEWDLNMLEKDVAAQKTILGHIFYNTNVGDCHDWLAEDLFGRWVDAIKNGYNDNPFSNFSHACDVYAASYRFLGQMQWTCWLSDLDATVLLLAALSHDIAHPGVTNLFLVETGDELALRYNDKSPLENMHCAKLFEICKDPSTAIFSKMDTASYRAARTCAIDTILYTDNALHFELLKDVKKVYGTSSDICDAQAKAGQNLEAEYINGVLAPHSHLWLKVMLHLADISNPLNTFKLSKIWAEAVMEEFFRQGDQERNLGIPVGMLNDRGKVSTPSAQHGFINVLLAPLVFATMRVHSSMTALAPQMATTLQEWHKLWMAEAKQRPEDVTKHEEQIKKILDQVQELKASVPLMERENTRGGQVNFAGHWTCIETFGLDDFLAASGVGYMKRKAASSAPWPQWEFQQSGDNIVFVNHSALGHLREEFTVDGKPYTTVDGWKQQVQIIATWEKGALVVHKDGPQGKFRETRLIDDKGKLRFTLQPLKPELEHVSWGRVFERSKNK